MHRWMYVRSHNLSVHNQFLSRLEPKSELEKYTLDIKLTTVLELKVISYAYVL